MVMPRWMQSRFYIALALFLLAGVAVAACAPPKSSPATAINPSASNQKTPAQGLTQVDEGKGGVTVEATWVTREHLQQIAQDSLKEYPIDRYVLIHVTLDTHSVELSKFDLARLATLGVQGGAPLAAMSWVNIQDSGHHREGVLVFPNQSGEQRFSLGGKVELVLKGIAGVAERVFRWEL